MSKVTIFVCTNRRFSLNQPSCAARGSENILQQLSLAATGRNIIVEESCCFGHCQEGVVVKIAPNGSFYHHVTDQDVGRIVLDASMLKTKIQNENVEHIQKVPDCDD